PFLDELADRELEFTTAISPSSHTREAVPALLSGRYPDVFATNGYRYVPKTVADRLSEAGFRTAGFHSNPYVSRAYGYDSGFDTFDDDLVLGRNRFVALAQRALNKFVLNKGEYHARAAEINDRSLSWLDSLDDDLPFFLWNHYMDPHGPYNPPTGYTYADRELSNDEAQTLYQKTIDRPDAITDEERQSLIDAYDGEIRYLDDQLRAFFHGLDDRRLLEESLIVVTADHGDAFGEHGYYTHPRYLHESLLHVPLIVSPPDEGGSETVTTPVSTLDIVPTIMEYVGETETELPRGPLVNRDGELVHDGGVVFASATGEDEHEGIRRFAARGERWKVVLAREIDSGKIVSEGIYDLAEDPTETEALSMEKDGSRRVIQQLKDFSVSRLDSVETKIREENTEQSAQVDERLEALGYK
ncbi:arylsulfatase, partial [Halorubrum sp. SS5]